MAQIKALGLVMKRRILAFSLAAASLMVVGLRPITETFTLAWEANEYSYLSLILPVSIALSVAEQRRWRQRSKSVSRPGVIVLVLGIAINLAVWTASKVMTPDVQLACEMFGLVVGCIGVFIVAFGVAAAKSNGFALFVLFGLVPPPRSVLDAAIALLQGGSTWAAHGLFSLLGVPVLQHRFQLIIPGLAIDVSKECSSIRSSTLLVIAACVLAQLTLQTRLQKALLIAVSIPLSIAKNGVRIVTIALLGTRLDPGYLNGRLHHQGGILFFLLALLGLCAGIWALRRAAANRHPINSSA